MARTRPRPTALPLVLFALLAAGGVAVADGVEGIAVGRDQVERGATIYRAQCTFCHGAELQGGGFPALSGPAFAERWDERSLGELFSFVSTNMPLGQAGSLSDEAYADVIAFVLSHNGVVPGDAEYIGREDPAATTLLDLTD